MSKATLGTEVYFWGAQWFSENDVNGSGGANSFKGYASSAIKASCGGTWNAHPGKGDNPNMSVPSIMSVFATSSVSKSGSEISDTIQKIVLVQESDYSNNQTGRGTVIGTIC